MALSSSSLFSLKQWDLTWLLFSASGYCCCCCCWLSLLNAIPSKLLLPCLSQSVFELQVGKSEDRHTDRKDDNWLCKHMLLLLLLLPLLVKQTLRVSLSIWEQQSLVWNKFSPLSWIIRMLSLTSGRQYANVCCLHLCLPLITAHWSGNHLLICARKKLLSKRNCASSSRSQSRRVLLLSQIGDGLILRCVSFYCFLRISVRLFLRLRLTLI